MPQGGGQKNAKTLVGVLSTHDSDAHNEDLAHAFEYLYKHKKEILERFHFVFTGGTFDRVVLGKGDKAHGIEGDALRFVRRNSTRLPTFNDGGVTILADLVVQRQCSIVWTFQTPITTHWLNPENLALTRLCDTWKGKRLWNSKSVKNWFENEADMDGRRNQQSIPVALRAGYEKEDTPVARARKKKDYYVIDVLGQEGVGDPSRHTIALIAHDACKDRMVDFAIEYEDELERYYPRILATGTTGQEILGATRRLKDRIRLCRSGPKGGDIEIATEILFGRCHAVVFFLDPLHPHPHADDIRAVFAACMRKNNVQIFTNEVQARRWMDYQ